MTGSLSEGVTEIYVSPYAALYRGYRRKVEWPFNGACGAVAVGVAEAVAGAPASDLPRCHLTGPRAATSAAAPEQPRPTRDDVMHRGRKGEV